MTVNIEKNTILKGSLEKANIYVLLMDIILKW